MKALRHLVSASALSCLLAATAHAAPTTNALASWKFENAQEFTTHVGPSWAAPGVSAELSTQADPFNEPAGFSNGVTGPSFFATGSRAFILHNAGSDRGSNERDVTIRLTTPSGAALKFVQLMSQSNATTNPLSVAVEWSRDSSFSAPLRLGQFIVKGGQPTIATVSSNIGIPAGTSYLRLRSLTAIPDGSNYIAYDDLILWGSANAASTSPDCTKSLICPLSIGNWECSDPKGRIGTGDNYCKAADELRTLACNAGESFSLADLKCADKGFGE